VHCLKVLCCNTSLLTSLWKGQAWIGALRLRMYAGLADLPGSTTAHEQGSVVQNCTQTRYCRTVLYTNKVVLV